MTTYFVTRHPGAREWAARRGIAVDRMIEHLDPDTVRPGDCVIGTLPVNLAAAVCARGGRYLNLSLKLPPELRGRELDADTLEALGAEIEEYAVRPVVTAAKPSSAPSAGATVHVCLVSEQVLANLIPALMDRPHRAYLVATDEMRRKGVVERLGWLLEREGIEADVRSGCPDSDLEGLREIAAALVAELVERHPKEAIALNVTGGTKLMALTFVDAFRTRLPQAILFYTDTRHGRLLTLGEDSAPARPMTSVLDLESYLAAYALEHERARSDEPDWKARAAARRDAAYRLALHAGRNGPIFPTLNRLVNQALDEQTEALVRPEQTFPRVPRGHWLQALQVLERHGLLTLRSEDCIRIPDADAAHFLRGGWLEEYAWAIASDLRPDDLGCGVRVSWEGEASRPSQNEFDLLVVHRNRMLVVECKSGRLNEDGGKEQDVLTKLNALGRKAGGTLVTTLLLSASPLHDALRDRARQLEIEVLEGEHLVGLKHFIESWM